MTKKSGEGSAGQEERKVPRTGRKLLLAGLLGSVLGAVAGLMLAPWRGADARRKLKDAAGAAGASAKEKGAAVREKAGAALQRIRDKHGGKESEKAEK
jgi:gas vesicle protein